MTPLVAQVDLACILLRALHGLRPGWVSRFANNRLPDRPASAQAMAQLGQLERRPLFSDPGQDKRVEQDVDRQEALVGAEAARITDPPFGLLATGAEPDPFKVVIRLADVAHLVIMQQLTGQDLAFAEH